MARSPILTALVASLVALGAFAVSCLVEMPGLVGFGFATDYAAMAEAPFALQGPFPHRLLGPTIAHVLGLSGDRYCMFGHGTVIALLGVFHAVAVARGIAHWRAALLVLVIATTPSIALFKGHVGYSEPLSYLLMVAGLAAVHRPGWFWCLQGLALLNHEQALLFSPWLVWLRCRAGGRLFAEARTAAILAVGYLLFRWVVAAVASRQGYTMQFYADAVGSPAVVAGLLVIAVLVFSFYFGLLPLLLWWDAARLGWRESGFGLALFAGATFALCAVARDTPRFVSYFLVPIWLAGTRLMQQPRGPLVLGVLGGCSAIGVVIQRDHVLPEFLTALSTSTSSYAEPMAGIVTVAIPEHWPLFTAFAAALTAVGVAGIAWGRADRPRTANAESTPEPPAP